MFGEQLPQSTSLGWRTFHVNWLEIVWAALAVPLAFFLRNPETLDASSVQTVVFYAGVSAIVALATFPLVGTDKSLSRYFSLRDAWLIVVASVIVAAVSAAVHFSFLRLQEVPRSLPMLHAIVLASGLLIGRAIARHRSRRRSLSSVGVNDVENVIVVGATRLAWFYLRTIDEIAPGSRRVVAILDRRPKFFGRSMGGRPIIGAVEGISRTIEEYAVHGLVIHRVVIADARERLSPAALAEIERVRVRRGIEVQSLDELLVLPRTQVAAQVKIAHTEGLAQLRSAIETRGYWVVKRCLDIVAASVLLVLLLPAAILLVPLTLLDVGFPLLFWQNRIGRNGRPVPIHKFRTLRSPIDEHGNRVPDAKRLSAIGRMVRSSHLDEIPQLLSVLRGDMSLVGPRPLLPVDQPDEIGLRLMVSPGLTGWAQINGGTKITAEEKNALDEWYVRHATLFLDISILLRTPLTMLRGEHRNEAAIALAMEERWELERMLRSGRGGAAPGGDLAGSVVTLRAGPSAGESATVTPTAGAASKAEIAAGLMPIAGAIADRLPHVI